MQQMNVLEYLERTVRRLPDKPAFVGEDMTMTFGQVYRASRAIGSALARRGMEGEPVAVFMPKCPQTIAAFFGCVYGGCHYVPLDSGMPRLRVEMILQNIRARMMICDESTRGLPEELGFDGETALYEELAAGPEDALALDRIRDRQLDTDPVYVVFTSGSTGVPKGVTACHRSVIDYIENLSEVLGLGEETVFANQSPLYFDACLKELYPTLKFGATTYLTPERLFMYPMALVDYLNEHRVNTICWVASALTMISALGTFEKAVPQYLRTVAFGSEVFPPRQLRRWQEALPQAQFINLYGPTEATGMSCYYKVERSLAPDEPIPIGRPFRNTGVLLLDGDRPAAPGEVGEICLRGTCLALGYYRDAERTDASFVRNPLNDRYPERIYRTGDLGRYNERGELVFVSRKDHQIKHMGHRVELGEIELNACRLEPVRAACCTYDEEKGKLVLWYVGGLTAGELIAALKERLPRYMLPNLAIPLERMPLTTNGKVDRAALGQMYEQRNR